MKIRKGKVGGFREEVSTHDINFLNAVMDEMLSKKFPYVPC
ncbi:hypothetical protein ACFL0O_11900 [Thermodesulfobacteriota bacterium]